MTSDDQDRRPARPAARARPCRLPAAGRPRLGGPTPGGHHERRPRHRHPRDPADRRTRAEPAHLAGRGRGGAAHRGRQRVRAPRSAAPTTTCRPAGPTERARQARDGHLARRARRSRLREVRRAVGRDPGPAGARLRRRGRRHHRRHGHPDAHDVLRRRARPTRAGRGAARGARAAAAVRAASRSASATSSPRPTARSRCAASAGRGRPSWSSSSSRPSRVTVAGPVARTAAGRRRGLPDRDAQGPDARRRRHLVAAAVGGGAWSTAAVTR